MTRKAFAVLLMAIKRPAMGPLGALFTACCFYGLASFASAYSTGNPAWSREIPACFVGVAIGMVLTNLLDIWLALRSKESGND
ncbi:hypothetical protein [Pseudoroseomonas cervicalis]|uniref:hypothetical protein n=1 Tax=Teichococcus cervicalis TaxID=204525 RepID=UPI002787F099|nr:hypothetical protein [Pseudoroseomonas cervicalis]MDQ1081419.1 hypothetical protein [Pseudoroseomonas cervicalis]